MNTKNVFHPGEMLFQEQSGKRETANKLASSVIVDHLPQQHQNFYPLLNTLFVASIDETGAPWASILCGQPGFVYAVDNKNLRIKSTAIQGDPLDENIKNNPYLGILGLEFQTRRRNRVAGKLTCNDSNGINVQVKQALGNCPKYIQARNAIISDHIKVPEDKKEIIKVERLTGEIKQLIINADTFFIASYYPESNDQGADISHRGGKPGFIHIESDNTLSFDEYTGNNLFMTLGNLYCNPIAGLLFIDFESGDTLQLSCNTEIINIQNSDINTQKKWRVKLSLNYGWLIRSALDIKWNFIDYSRFL